jgi:hypothetical protein
VSLGTIVIDEMVFPITDILLERGKIFVRAEVKGPVPERKEGVYELRLHGQDGSFITMMRSRMQWSEVWPGDTLTIDFAMDTIVSTPQGRSI